MLLSANPFPSSTHADGEKIHHVLRLVQGLLLNLDSWIGHSMTWLRWPCQADELPAIRHMHSVPYNDLTLLIFFQFRVMMKSILNPYPWQKQSQGVWPLGLWDSIKSIEREKQSADQVQLHLMTDKSIFFFEG